MNKIHTLLYASKLLLLIQSNHLWAEKIRKIKFYENLSIYQLWPEKKNKIHT